VGGSHHRKVPPVEGGDLGDSQAFGHGHDGGISSTQPQVCITLSQVSHAPKVRQRQIGQDKLASADRPKESRFCSGAALSLYRR